MATSGYQPIQYTPEEVDRIKAAAREAIAKNRRVMPAMRAITHTFISPRRSSAALYMKWLSVADASEVNHRPASPTQHSSMWHRTPSAGTRKVADRPRHPQGRLPVPESDFILPPTKAQLMAGR